MMDVTEMNKVANRKKLSSDVEKLREKVSRENRKIIKLKVAQDTAYWDVKEKLRQVETNHEKLQQNMVEVQMQYETVSGQYQDELRFRPETLNKLESTREICDVLEEYSERLRDTLSRCKADQAALHDAYQRSGQLVRHLKDQQTRANDHSQLVNDNLQEKVKLVTEHNAQLLQYFNAEKQRMEGELAEAKGKLQDANSFKEELMGAGRELNRELEQCRRDLQKKEDAVTSLQNDIKQLLKEFGSRAAEVNNTVLKQEKELKESSSAIEALKQALANQEAFTKSVVDQSGQLQDKVASLEEQLSEREDAIKDLKRDIQCLNGTNESLKTENEALNEKNQGLQKEILDKNEILAAMEIELQNLTQHLSALESEKCGVEAAVAAAANEVKTLVSRIEEMTAAGNDMDAKVQELEAKMRADRDSFDKKLKQVNGVVEEKERDLTRQAETVSRLMQDVKAHCDTQARLEGLLAGATKDLEAARLAMRDRENTLVAGMEKLEITVRNKDEELRQQMNVILELRSDKERLNVKIVSMQSKIDNIQKELTGPAAAHPLTTADQDDNAVMFSPAPPQKGEFLVPRGDPPCPAIGRSQRERAPAPPSDSLIFNFLSDGSMDGDNSLDPVVVNRRFEALSRGERLPPVPLSALKKRRPSQQCQARRHARNADDDFPLSQMSVDPNGKKERSFFKNRRSGDRVKRAKLDKGFDKEL